MSCDAMLRGKEGARKLRRAHAKQAAIYRVESIRGVQVLAQRFVQPRNFDLASVWRKEVARFKASLKRMKAEIRVAESAMSRVAGAKR